MTIPIVGAFHRPPAKAIQDSLPLGHPLELVAEPDNPYDENAVMVLVTTESLANLDPGILAHMRSQVESFGYDLDAIIEDLLNVQLGYIPRVMTHEVLPRLVEGKLPAKVTFTSAGKPGVEI